jgi:hypothetical protein
MCATSALAILAKYVMGCKSIQKKAKEQSAAALQAKNMHAKWPQQNMHQLLKPGG